jgi:hypothetical protein
LPLGPFNSYRRATCNGGVSTSVCLRGAELDSGKSDSLTLRRDRVWAGFNPKYLGLNMDQYSALSRALWSFLGKYPGAGSGVAQSWGSTDKVNEVPAIEGCRGRGVVMLMLEVC